MSSQRARSLGYRVPACRDGRGGDATGGLDYGAGLRQRAISLRERQATRCPGSSILNRSGMPISTTAVNRDALSRQFQTLAQLPCRAWDISTRTSCHCGLQDLYISLR